MEQEGVKGEKLPTMKEMQHRVDNYMGGTINHIQWLWDKASSLLSDKDKEVEEWKSQAQKRDNEVIVLIQELRATKTENERLKSVSQPAGDRDLLEGILMANGVTSERISETLINDLYAFFSHTISTERKEAVRKKCQVNGCENLVREGEVYCEECNKRI